MAANVAPDARGQTETVTKNISKNITLDVTDNDGDDVEVKIATFQANGWLGGMIYQSTHKIYVAYYRTGTE